MTYFSGMLSTQDWQADQDPQSWLEMILRIDPNGDAPITAITSILPSEPLEHVDYNWFTKAYEDQRGAVTGVYIDALLQTAYVSGGTSGSALYIQMSAADTEKFSERDQVLLRYSEDPTVDVNCKVTGVTLNGANSYIAVLLIEDDDNSNDYDLSNCDTAWIIGDINSEGASRPDAKYQVPTVISNNTQIWRESLEITGTASVTRLRTGNSYEDQKLDALLRHGKKIEKSCIFGVAYKGVGSNKKQERTTRGIIDTIRTYAPNNISNFKTDTDVDFIGKKFSEVGGIWLMRQFERIFRYGSNVRVAFCGSLAMLALQEYVMTIGDFNFESETDAFGVKVVRWTTPFGDVIFRRHPQFSAEPTARRMVLILDLAQGDIRFRPMKDRNTHFREAPDMKKSSEVGTDGKAEEFLTEGGFEFHFPETCGVLYELGTTNNVGGGA